MSPTRTARQGLTSRVVRIEAVTPQLLKQMLALMRRFYEDVREEKFREDLAGKRWCVLVEDVTGRIRGFSTQTMLATQVGGRTVRALYSGISRGTESLVFLGKVPPSEYERMRAPFQAGKFPACLVSSSAI